MWCEADTAWVVSEALLLSGNAAHWEVVPCSVSNCALHTTVHKFPALNKWDGAADVRAIVARAAVYVHCSLQTLSNFVAAPKNVEQLEEGVTSCDVLANGNGGTALVHTVYADSASHTLHVAQTLHMAAGRRSGNKAVVEFLRAHPACTSQDTVFVCATRTIESRERRSTEVTRPVHLSAYIAYEVGEGDLLLTVLDASVMAPEHCAARANRLRTLCESLECSPISFPAPPQLQGHFSTPKATMCVPTSPVRVVHSDRRMDASAQWSVHPAAHMHAQSQRQTDFQSNLQLGSFSPSRSRSPNEPLAALPPSVPPALHPLLSLYLQPAWRRVSFREGCEVKMLDAVPPVYCATLRIACTLDTLRRAAEHIAPGISAVVAPAQAQSARLLSPSDGACGFFAHCASGPTLLGFVAAVGQDALCVHHIARAMDNRLRDAHVQQHCSRLVELQRMCEDTDAGVYQKEETENDRCEGSFEGFHDEGDSVFIEATTIEDDCHMVESRRETIYPLNIFSESVEADESRFDELSIYTCRERFTPTSTRHVLSPEESEGEGMMEQWNLPSPMVTLSERPKEDHGPQKIGSTSAAKNWILRVHVQACRNLANDDLSQQNWGSSLLFVVGRACGVAARTPAVPHTDSARFNGPPLSFFLPRAGNYEAKNKKLYLTAILRTEEGYLHRVGAASLPLFSLTEKRWTQWIALHDRESRKCGELLLSVDGGQPLTEANSNENDVNTFGHRRNGSRRRLKSDKQREENHTSTSFTPNRKHFSGEKDVSQSMKENGSCEVRNVRSSTRTSEREHSRSRTVTISEPTEQNKINVKKEKYSSGAHKNNGSFSTAIDPYASPRLPSNKNTTSATHQRAVLRIMHIRGLSDEDGLPLCSAMCRVSVKSAHTPLATRDVPLTSLAHFNGKFDVMAGVPARLSVIAGDMVVGLADISTEALSEQEYRTVVLVRDAGTHSAAPGGFASITIQTALMSPPDESASNAGEMRDRLLLYLWSHNRRMLHRHDLMGRKPLKPHSTSLSPMCILKISLRRLRLLNSRICTAKCESPEVFAHVGPHFAPVGTPTLRGVLPGRDELLIVVAGVGVAVLPLCALPTGADVTTKLPLVAVAATRDAHVTGSVTLNIVVGLPAAVAAAQPLVLPEAFGVARVRQLLYRHDPRDLHRAACMLVGQGGREDACIQALAARLGVATNGNKDLMTKHMTLRLLGTRGLDAAHARCYVKVYLNGDAVLRTADRHGCGMGAVTVPLHDPQRARLRCKVAQHRFLISNLIAFTEMRLCCLRGGEAENVRWLPLFGTESEKLGELGIAIKSEAFPSVTPRKRDAKTDETNGNGGESDGVEKKVLVRVEEDVASLLRRYDPMSLERVQALVASAGKMTRAHADLRRKLIPRVVNVTIFVSVESVRLHTPRDNVRGVSGLTVTASCDGETAFDALPLAQALRLDICAGNNARRLEIAVREPRNAICPGSHPADRGGATLALSKGKNGFIIGTPDALPGIETGRAVLSLRALLTPELYDEEQAVTVPLVAFMQSPDALLTLQQREAGGGSACEHSSDVVGNVTLRIRTAACDKLPRCLRFSPTVLARHGPVDCFQIRKYEQSIAETLAVHDPCRLVDLHHVVYEQRVGRGKWQSSLRKWKSALDQQFGVGSSAPERSQKERNGTSGGIRRHGETRSMLNV